MFFLTFLPSGRVHWQGRVIHDDGDELKVELYSWLTGEVTDVVFIPKSAAGSWRFFEDEAEWNREAGRAFVEGQR